MKYSKFSIGSFVNAFALAYCIKHTMHRIMVNINFRQIFAYELFGFGMNNIVGYSIYFILCVGMLSTSITIVPKQIWKYIKISEANYLGHSTNKQRFHVQFRLMHAHMHIRYHRFSLSCHTAHFNALDVQWRLDSSIFNMIDLIESSRV